MMLVLEVPDRSICIKSRRNLLIQPPKKSPRITKEFSNDRSSEKLKIQNVE